MCPALAAGDSQHEKSGVHHGGRCRVEAPRTRRGRVGPPALRFDHCVGVCQSAEVSHHPMRLSLAGCLGRIGRPGGKTGKERTRSRRLGGVIHFPFPVRPRVGGARSGCQDGRECR